MQKPDLNQMCETFIRIPPKHNHINIIRSKIHLIISRLMDEGVINWYCFLIHDRNSGVPTTEDDKNAYFHIRVGLSTGINQHDFLNSLPDYCVMTRKIKREQIESIAGIDKSILKNEQIEEAWRIIGEISESVMNMLDIHKEEVEIPYQQIAQYHLLFGYTD